jgi:hypothetical protein
MTAAARRKVSDSHADSGVCCVLEWCSGTSVEPGAGAGMAGASAGFSMVA